jgi:TolA-binding protein
MAKRAKPKARPERSIARLTARSAARTPMVARATGSAAQIVRDLPRPSAPPQPPSGPPLEAVEAFERSVAAMHRHQYGEASDGFTRLIQAYPSERGLLDRARVYLDLCQRELRRRPAEPRTVEERLTAATAALNVGDDRSAERLAESVLAEEPRQDLALYLLAVIAARRDATEAALAYLGEAIAVSPDAGAQARLDSDFESLREDERFRQLVDTQTGSGAAGGNRRGRRGRAER